jgi:hypothetical protein
MAQTKASGYLSRIHPKTHHHDVLCLNNNDMNLPFLRLAIFFPPSKINNVTASKK